MAEETIIIDVQFKANDVAKKLGQVNKEINELTDANRVLRNEIKNGNDVMGENSLKLAENESKLKSLNSEKRNYLGIVEEEIRDNKSYGTSINDLRDKLRSLTATYNALSDAERESDLGKNIQKEAAKTQEEISKLNQKIGNFRDNVGNYKSALTGFFEQIGGKWSKLVKLFTTNPIGLAISALVLLFNKLKSSFEKGDEAGQKIKSFLSSIQPLLEVVGDSLGLIINLVSTFLSSIGNLLTSLSSENKTINTLSVSLRNYAEVIAETQKALKNLDVEEQYLNSTRKISIYYSNLFKRIAEDELVSINARRQSINQYLITEKEALDAEEDIIKKRIDNLKKEKEALEKIRDERKKAYDNLVDQRSRSSGIDAYILDIDVQNALGRLETAENNVLLKSVEINEELSRGFSIREQLSALEVYAEKQKIKLNELEIRQLYKINELENNLLVAREKRETKILELRRMSLDSDKYSAEERAKFLDEAIKLEKQTLVDELNIAKTRLKIAEEVKEKNQDNSQETINNIEKLKAEVLKAERNLNEGIIRLEEERYSVIKKNMKSIIDETSELEKELRNAALSSMKVSTNEEIEILKKKYKEQLDYYTKNYVKPLTEKSEELSNTLNNLSGSLDGKLVGFDIDTPEGLKTTIEELDNLIREYESAKDVVDITRKEYNSLLKYIEENYPGDGAFVPGDLVSQLFKLDETIKKYSEIYAESTENLSTVKSIRETVISISNLREEYESTTDTLSYYMDILNDYENYLKTIDSEYITLQDKEIKELRNKYDDEISLIEKQIKDRQDLLEQATASGYELSEEELSKVNQQLDYLNQLKIYKEKEFQEEKLKIQQEYAQIELEDNYRKIEQKYAMEMELARRDLFKKAEIQVSIASEYKKYLDGLTEEEQISMFTSLENYRLALEMATQDVEAALEARTIAYAEFTEKTLDSFDRMFGSLSTLMSTFNDENEKNTGAQKALAVAQFAFSSGAAIAKGISEASAAGPFPYNLAAIATTVATILANLATARKFFNESNKYATGGIVPGNSYSGDNITARVNSGEMILTREQQKALFDMANNNLRTGNNFDIMVASFSEALKNQPAPVLNYEEFTNFSNDIANKNKLILK